MRTLRLLPLALPLLASGCDAAGLGLGIGTQCASEKQQVRQRHGVPDDVNQGSRSEQWVYNDERLAYTFSWDQEGENCSVSSTSFVRLPPPR